jgi:hypothetical protein
MAILERSDLLYADKYSWTALKDDDPKITGIPDSTPFNRKEGYEVLALINRFLAKYKFRQKTSGQKVERLIKEHLPGALKTQRLVEDWLVANWEEYDS